MANLSETPTAVYAVVQNTYWQNPGGGSIQGKQTVKSGATTSAGSAIYASSVGDYVHRVFDEDPDTSAAWTESAVNAIESGVEVV
jgi:hypothetical protein